MKEMPCCLESGPRVTGTATGMGIEKAAGTRKERGENKMKLEILMILMKL